MRAEFAEELDFALRPTVNVRRLQRHGAWQALQGPVRFEIDPGATGFPQGWVLLTCKLTRTILDGSAELIVEAARGSFSFQIPVSPSGSVYELIRLPRGIRRMVWQPSQSDGTFEHSDLHLRKVTPARRLWLMTRRVAYMLWTRPVEQRQHVGLGFLSPFVNLPRAYRASGRLRAYAHNVTYAQWFEQHAALTEADRLLIRRRIRRLRERPHFAVVVIAGDAAGEAVAATVASVELQLYRIHSLVVVREGERPDLPAKAGYVMLVDAGDRLAEHALYWMAEVIARRGDIAMAYADDDVVDAQGEHDAPRFKPAWSPEHLRSINYIGRCAVLRRAEFDLQQAGLGSGDAGHGLLLGLTRALQNSQIAHVPAVLLHRSADNPRPHPVPRLRHALPPVPPLVSIVIPTRDAVGLLRSCIHSVERLTQYPRYEILVVDNGSRDEAALRYLDGLRHTVLRYPAAFNFAAMNNLAANAARGDVLVLLNNDTEVITPDWLDEMLGHLHQDGVGVVGAKLHYSDGKVQHAGDGVGAGGCSDHLHNGIAEHDPGYCYRAAVAHEVSAVTAACLMTWKALYVELGGLDERQLPVTFNDVDYCLRAQGAGYRVVFTPHARLYHHESSSRGRGPSDVEARAVRVMRRRWGRRLQVDPYYNPNLNYEPPDFALARMPRVRKPWLRYRTPAP
jgi:GT2 family glycosyltransferase